MPCDGVAVKRFVACLLAIACERAAMPAPASPAEPPPVAPNEPLAPVVPPAAPSGPVLVRARPACELELSTAAVRRANGYEVVARVHNPSARAVGFEAEDRCPSGPVVFRGLPDGYDYYGTCAMGACAGPRPRLKLVVAPGATLTLASINVDPEGSACNRELPLGRYPVSFALEIDGTACEGGGAIVERLGRSEPPPVPLPVPSAPPAGPNHERPAPKRGKCPPMPACGIACPPGSSMAHDAQGCSLCACEDPPGVLR